MGHVDGSPERRRSPRRRHDRERSRSRSRERRRRERERSRSRSRSGERGGGGGGDRNGAHRSSGGRSRWEADDDGGRAMPPPPPTLPPPPPQPQPPAAAAAPRPAFPQQHERPRGRHGRGGDDDDESDRGGTRWGKQQDDGGAAAAAAAAAPPLKVQQPNMGLSGKLAAESNRTADGAAVMKYQPPPELRVCKRPAWRLYVFKGASEAAAPITLNQLPFYLFGKERGVADVPIDHPSCSRQHAVVAFREVEVDDSDGIATVRAVKPYVIDLESVNGTSLNGERLEPARYYELLSSDVLRFGLSTREFVILREDAA